MPVETIRELAREFAQRKPAAIRIGYGVDRWYYCRLHRARSRESGHRHRQHRHCRRRHQRPRRHLRAPLNLQPFRTPGGREAATLDIIGLMQAIEHGDPYPVKSLWLSASNMFNQTSANRGRVLRDIVPKFDLLVVVDQFMTDSAALADIVLPACTIFEKTI